VSQSEPLTEQDIVERLEKRLGPVHARQRLGIENDYEAQIFGHGINFFHPENWYSLQAAIRTILRLTGLYWRGQKNTERIEIRHNYIVWQDLPLNFEGFTILHLSDLHVDMNPGVMQRLIELLREVQYDICVLTGDYRGQAFGPFHAALEGVHEVRSHLKELVYGVLGNHDTIRMIPGLEEIGIRMLVNESEPIVRHGQRIYLAGIDDAHYYRSDNIEKTTYGIPQGEFSILLSHTPEIYRQAAHAGFKLLLSGHTHGGQVCLPGSIPIMLDAVLPRRMASGPWKYHGMAGYTSVGVGSAIVAVRFNCPPEITLHHLQRATDSERGLSSRNPRTELCDGSRSHKNRGENDTPTRWR
jgi:predicted MPP superfamily phosphohydrolase